MDAKSAQNKPRKNVDTYSHGGESSECHRAYFSDPTQATTRVHLQCLPKYQNGLYARGQYMYTDAQPDEGGTNNQKKQTNENQTKGEKKIPAERRKTKKQKNPNESKHKHRYGRPTEVTKRTKATTTTAEIYAHESPSELFGNRKKEENE